jgi:uncharacterized protein YjbI with pentapeptide repeats
MATSSSVVAALDRESTPDPFLRPHAPALRLAGVEVLAGRHAPLDTGRAGNPPPLKPGTEARVAGATAPGTTAGSCPIRALAISLQDHRWPARMARAQSGPCWREAMADLSRSDVIKILAVAENARLAGVDLSGLDLHGLNFSGADLIRADLAGANLSGAYMRGARLESANLEGAIITDANLKEANLKAANLRDADLTNTIMTDANLFEAILEGARLDRTIGLNR